MDTKKNMYYPVWPKGGVGMVIEGWGGLTGGFNGL